MSSTRILTIIAIIIGIGIMSVLMLQKTPDMKSTKGTNIKNDTNASLGDINEYFNSNKDHDTIYFKIKDEEGNESFVHDSGNKPNANKYIFNILKKEFNEGKTRELGYPKEIHFGRQIKKLTNQINLLQYCNYYDAKLKDNGLYYTITLNNDHTIYYQ